MFLIHLYSYDIHLSSQGDTMSLLKKRNKTVMRLNNNNKMIACCESGYKVIKAIKLSNVFQKRIVFYWIKIWKQSFKAI